MMMMQSSAGCKEGHSKNGTLHSGSDGPKRVRCHAVLYLVGLLLLLLLLVLLLLQLLGLLLQNYRGFVLKPYVTDSAVIRECRGSCRACGAG
jgi:hypothetical protein